MESVSQTERNDMDWPMTIFTRSESYELVQLQDVQLPGWIHAESW